MTRRLALIPLALLAAAVAMFAFYALRHDPHVTPDALVGHPAPNVSLPALAGGPATPLRGAIGQGPVLINFFASWCAPCAEEQPQLMALRAQGVRIIGIAYKDDPVAARGFLTRLGDPFSQVLTDRSGDAGVEFGVSGVPETFLVGANGVILAKHAGPLTPADAERLLETAGGARP